jgi:hypothetical protein
MIHKLPSVSKGKRFGKVLDGSVGDSVSKISPSLGRTPEDSSALQRTTN